MRRLTAALIGTAVLLALPAGASAQGYGVPSDNPFVGQPGAAPEIWAYGFRNPFRFSFDRANGTLIVGDVGSAPPGGREEVNVIGKGQNFGWPCREGAAPGPQSCDAPGAVNPVFAYPTGDASAITGGFVVRDPALPAFSGRYLYADFFDPDIRSIELNAGAPDDSSTGATVEMISSFGEDALGRIHAVSLSGGDVYRLVAGPGGLEAAEVVNADAPMHVTAPPGDASRLFVVERAGRVRVVRDGALLPAPFLDLSGETTMDGERGMQSMAVSPDYAESGLVYVFYTDSDGDIRVEEFRRSAGDPDRVDPDSRRNVLTLEHSQENNHNGGQLQFGPDGYLYVSIGDGGGQGDPERDAQNLGNLHGKILRIDPAAPPQAGITTVRARVKRRQRMLRLRGVVAYARCDRACTATLGGRLRIGKRSFRLRRARRSGAADARLRLKARLGPRARRSLRRAIANGRRPRARLKLTALGADGVAAVPRTLRVRARP